MLRVGVSILAVIVQHANRIPSAPNYIAIFGLSHSTIIFHTISKRERSSGKVTEHRVYVLIFFTNFTRNISHTEKNSSRYYHKCT